MKKMYWLLGLFIMSLSVPMFANSADYKCDQEFERTLRYNKQYIFGDEFYAKDHDRWIWDWSFDYKEQYDYNQTGYFPKFDWTQNIRNADRKVAKGKTMELIRNRTGDFKDGSSDNIGVYQVLAVPPKRDKDNLFLRYGIQFSNDISGDNKEWHYECVHYAISRCGDGVIDTGYNEECDPNHPNWKDDNSCDPTTCKEKPPVCNSKYNGQTLESLTEGKHLCEVGSWSKFEYNENTHTWTWKCEAAGKGVECSAKKPYDGTFVVKKTLVSESKYVTQTGQELVWDITVTASGGDVKNMKIKDNLPPVLEYVSYTSTLPSGVTIAKDQPTFSNDKKSVYWETKGTLQSGNSIVLRVVTIVTTMPKNTDNYKNVACAAPEEQEKDEKCDDEQIPTEPSLRITKTFTDGTKNKTVKVGDEIAYKISFGNSGGAAATITSIKDFLPKNVEYVSSEIHIQRTSNHSSGTQTGDEEFKGYKVVDGVRIDIYGGLTLEPGDEGYIILTGKVLEENKENRTNFACIYLNDELVACDDATHNVGEVCEKLVIDPAATLALPNGGGSKNVTCTATSGQVAKTIEIDCGEGASGNRYITGSNVASLTGTCTYPSGSKTYSLECKVDGKSADPCKGSVTVSPGSTPPGCFIAGTKVLMADGTQKNIEDVKIGEKVLGSDGSINTVLGYYRPVLRDRHLWSINGSEYFVSDEHPFMTTEGWKSFNPEMTKLEIDLDTTELKVGDVMVTNNGFEEIEFVDYIDADYDTQLYNFMLDGDNTYYANGYLVHNKGGGSEGTSASPLCKSVKIESDGITCSSSDAKAYFRLTCDGKEYYSFDYKDGRSKDYDYIFDNTEKCKSAKKVECAVSKDDDKNGSWKTSSNCKKTVKREGSQECFNLNAGNFSIEEGEILPFYWNLFNMEEWVKDNDDYAEIDGNYGNAIDKYENPGSCEEGQEGQIALDSMVCTFNIYDGGSYNKTPLYTIVGPCLSADDVNPLSTPLLGAWYSGMVNTYCKNPNKKCYFSYNDHRSEGRALLNSAVYYIQNFGTNAGVYMNGERWDKSHWNFAGKDESSKSYGEYRIVLEEIKYLQCKGETWRQVSNPQEFTPCQSDFTVTNSYTVQKTPSGNLTASTEKLSKYRYLDKEQVFSELLGAISTSDYNKNQKVEKAMDDFINKYEKLAVKVDTNKFGGNGVTVKKVPGKDIYFIDGNATFRRSNSTINKAFTIVQTDPTKTVTINGNLQHNMMLLTKGNIIFNGNCTTDQTVKGIFYAGLNLKRSGVEKNTNITNNTWCTKGGLHVKGVLIGSNFEGLMKNSRSHLNDWFNTEDKKSSIMNGASVLIEYSPSIFSKSTMPPGAEDFTTALSIYKQ